MASQDSLQFYVSMESQIDSIETLINQKFDNIMTHVLERKLELLSEVKKLRTDLSNKEVERQDNLQEIRKLETVLDSLKANKLEHMVMTISAQISQKREELDHKEQGMVKFFCNTDEIQQKISSLGRIVEEVVPKYTNKMQPFTSIGKFGSISTNFNRPTGIALDKENERMFVIDSANHRIQVFSMECEFLQDFEYKRLKEPWGIAINQNDLYITDIGLHTVLKYDCTSYPVYIKSLNEMPSCSEEQLRKPLGITVETSTEGVYVADAKLNCVMVYSSDLVFQRKIGQNLCHPVDVKAYNDNIYVLDYSKPNMHKFNMAGCALSEIHLLNGSNSIETPQFFTIDCMGNFLISNWKTDTVDIAHSDGDIYCTIGSDPKTGTVLKSPKGVAVTRSGRIVVVSDTSKNWIQIF